MAAQVSQVEEVASGSVTALPTFKVFGLARGSYRTIECEASGTKAPCLIRFTARCVDGSDDRKVQHVSVCFTGKVEDEVRRLEDSLLIGDTVEIDGGDKYRIPDWTSTSFWYLALVVHNEAYELHVNYFEGCTVKTVRLRLGPDLQPKYAKEIRARAEEHLSNTETFARFFDCREWISEQLSNGVHVLMIDDFDAPMALAMLECNRRNRPLDVAHVKRLCIEATNNRWKRSESNICMDTNGDLINGQHRTHVAILTGISQIQTLAFGHDPNDIEHLDQGSKGRKAGDAVTIKQRTQFEKGVSDGDTDLRGMPPGAELNRIARAFAFMESSVTNLNTQAITYKVVEMYREDFVWMKPYVQKATKTGPYSVISNPFVRAAFMAAHHHRPDEIDAVLQALLRKELGPEGTAIHTLYDILDDRVKNPPKKGGPLPHVNQVFTCLRFHIEGKDLKKSLLTDGRKTKAMKGDFSTMFRFKVADSEGKEIATYLPGLAWRRFKSNTIPNAT